MVWWAWTDTRLTNQLITAVVIWANSDNEAHTHTTLVSQSIRLGRWGLCFQFTTPMIGKYSIMPTCYHSIWLINLQYWSQWSEYYRPVSLRLDFIGKKVKSLSDMDCECNLLSLIPLQCVDLELDNIAEWNGRREATTTTNTGSITQISDCFSVVLSAFRLNETANFPQLQKICFTKTYWNWNIRNWRQWKKAKYGEKNWKSLFDYFESDCRKNSRLFLCPLFFVCVYHEIQVRRSVKSPCETIMETQRGQAECRDQREDDGEREREQKLE